MSETRRFRLYRMLGATALVAAAWCARADELALNRVVLTTFGMAQFTHEGLVSPGSTVDLTVRLDQVDDLLKSLTVFDQEGAIGAVSLPGKAPLSELYRDLPFGPDALDSPRALLDALVGSEVEIAGPVTAKGRIFRVENEVVALPDRSGTVTRHRLALMTDRGLIQAVLEELTTLRFVDSSINAQVERALAGLTENRAKERRRLSIGFLGQASRTAAISYMIAAPIWKTTYRLILPRDGGNARLQGWAILENLTGGDWHDVDLVLVSGNPVALRQALYTAFFADRIEVPVTTSSRVVPRGDDQDERSPALRQPVIPAAERSVPMAAVPRLIAAPPAGPAEAFPAPPAPLSLGAAANAPESEEASTQLLYRFPAKITLAAGHTMMVPIIDREVPATQVWLYQPETSARHPLAAVRVRNDGDSGLPPGMLTTYEIGSDASVNFVGDAELPLLPKATSRFVTFALDAKTDIRRDDQGVDRTQLAKAVNGTLMLTTRSRRTISYEVTAPADEDRQIVIEEARAEGWRPASEMDGVEETPTRFRYTVAAPRGRTAKTALVLERTDSQTVVLTALSAEDVLARIQGLQNESAALKDTVAKLAGIVGDINKARAQRTQLEAERKKIVDDQGRVRQNLQSVGQASDLGRRYLGTLKAQEDRLAEIDRIDMTLENAIAADRLAAEQLARRLTL